MFSITKWIAVPAIAACFALTADTSTAEAGNGFLRVGGLHISLGGSGYSHGHYQHYTPRYGSSYRSYYGGYHGGYGHGHRHGYYHDTSHWDYHPTEIIRHGNHFHVQPGHYDWHQTGHWHH
ncbi:hypothetical protein [Novipirellula caenicola]|uniref:Uncharacterized protein n=1 Tax=Novipirellula caenicola TaxID=1536901 RepID=A0ABP9VRI0_9BACT